MVDDPRFVPVTTDDPLSVQCVADGPVLVQLKLLTSMPLITAD
jgi:hypothetical protein